MNLPFYLKNNLSYSFKEAFDSDFFLSVLTEKVNYFFNAKAIINKNTFYFISRHSLLFFKYEVYGNWNIENSNLKFSYQLRVSNLLFILISLLVLFGLISNFSFSGYMIFSLFFAIIFFYVNVWFINLYMKRMVKLMVSSINDHIEFMNIQKLQENHEHLFNQNVLYKFSNVTHHFQKYFIYKFKEKGNSKL